MLVIRLAIVPLFLIMGALPALAESDADLVRRYCVGMHQQYVMPDKTEADCIGQTHALEVEFSDYWYSALGQSLHYAYWTREIAAEPDAFPEWSSQVTTPKKAGIILVCRKPRDTCTDHYVRLFRIVDEFRLPITIWDCDQGDATLADCLKIDMPQSATPKLPLQTLAILAGLVALLAGLIVINGQRPPEASGDHEKTPTPPTMPQPSL